ncbi:MAG: signal peptidase I [Candidatus Electrothrix sp. AR1]|nr:signal peptidase I [Candidatus Electrothrix sp. AR1]
MKNNQAEKQKSVAREYTEAIVIALILAIFIRTFIVQAFKIPSGSMLQTLLIGDHILVSKFIYGIKNPFTDSVLIPIKSPKRGDIVVFKYPNDPKLDYIKRVVATGGDTVEIKNKKIFINGTMPENHYGEFKDTHILSPSEGP